MLTPKADAGLFKWADFYRSLGCSVVPLREGKLPAVQWKEFQFRVATRAEFGRWYIDERQWGMALVCGAVSGNLVRLDFDDPADFDTLEGRIPEAGPVFKSQRKGGGYGMLFRSTSPVPTLPQNTFKKFPKLEVRGEGSITVVPPTPGYEWKAFTGDIPTIDVPALLTRLFGFDLANRHRLADSVERTAGDELATLLRETSVGERSNNLVRIAGMLRARGIDLETALEVMEHNFEEHWPQEDMDWGQAKATFEGAWRRYEHEGVRYGHAQAPYGGADDEDEGIQVMRLDEIRPPTEQDVLVDHFLLAGEAGNTLIAAPAKVGKTSLMLDAAITMTRAEPVWGALKVARALKVAFVDQERKFQQIRENQLMMSAKIGLPDYGRLLIIAQTTGQFEIGHVKALDLLYGALSEFGPDAVVIDGWGWFVGHQASDPKLVKPALAWLKKVRQSLDCATVIIHHFKKAQFSSRVPDHSEVIDTLDQIEGLKRLVDQAQTALVYVPIAGSDTFNLLEGRTNKPSWDPMKFVIDYDETTLTHKVVSAEEGAELFDPETFRRLWAQTAVTRRTKNIINTVCNRTGFNRAQLAELLGVSRSQVSRWYSGLSNPSRECAEKLEEMYRKAKVMPLNLAKMPKAVKK